MLPGGEEMLYKSVTWRLVSHVWRWTRRAPQPGHDVARPCIDTDLTEAEVGGEAGFGGADVAAHCGPIEKQPAT